MFDVVVTDRSSSFGARALAFTRVFRGQNAAQRKSERTAVIRRLDDVTDTQLDEFITAFWPGGDLLEASAAMAGEIAALCDRFSRISDPAITTMLRTHSLRGAVNDKRRQRTRLLGPHPESPADSAASEMRCRTRHCRAHGGEGDPSLRTGLNGLLRRKGSSGRRWAGSRRFGSVIPPSTLRGGSALFTPVPTRNDGETAPFRRLYSQSGPRDEVEEPGWKGLMISIGSWGLVALLVCA